MNSLRFKVPSTSSHLASNLLATHSIPGNGSLMNRMAAEALEDASNGDLSPNDAQVFIESKKIYDFVQQQQQQQRQRDSTFTPGYYSSPFATVNRSNVNSGNSSFTTTGHHQSNLVSRYTCSYFTSVIFSPSSSFSFSPFSPSSSSSSFSYSYFSCCSSFSFCSFSLGLSFLLFFFVLFRMKELLHKRNRVNRRKVTLEQK